MNDYRKSFEKQTNSSFAMTCIALHVSVFRFVFMYSEINSIFVCYSVMNLKEGFVNFYNWEVKPSSSFFANIKRSI